MQYNYIDLCTQIYTLVFYDLNRNREDQQSIHSSSQPNHMATSKTMAALLVLVFMAVTAQSYNLTPFWQRWNNATTDPNFIKSNFKIPPIPGKFYRLRWNYTQIVGNLSNPYMKYQNAYSHPSNPDMKLICAPRTYLYNSTVCLRDPNYWQKLVPNSTYCYPNYEGNRPMDSVFTPLAGYGTCTDGNRYYATTECCFQDLNMAFGKFFYDVQNSILITNLTGLYNLQFPPV